MNRARQWAITESQERAPEIERHYTPQEIAEMWGLDEHTIRRKFIDQPGVLKIGSRLSRRRKRQYITLRIPASVLARYHRENAR